MAVPQQDWRFIERAPPNYEMDYRPGVHYKYGKLDVAVTHKGITATANERVIDCLVDGGVLAVDLTNPQVKALITALLDPRNACLWCRMEIGRAHV